MYINQLVIVLSLYITVYSQSTVYLPPLGLAWPKVIQKQTVFYSLTPVSAVELLPFLDNASLNASYVDMPS